MQVTFFACERPCDIQPAAGDYVVRLAGMPQPGDVAPARLAEISDLAMADIRAEFPSWLWQWAQSSGALGLQTFDGPISWWWYAPASEMSPMRSSFIREIYWLVLLRTLIETHQATRVTWVGDDPRVAAAARSVAAAAGAAFNDLPAPVGWRGAWLWDVGRRIRAFLRHAGICWMLKAFRVGADVPESTDVVLYSRFPVLWDLRDGVWQERMFGSWPDHLAANGLSVSYAAVYTGTAGSLIANRLALREWCSRQRVVLAESLVSMSQVAASYLDPRLVWRYWRWRSNRRHDALSFSGIGVTDLFWRELDKNVLSPEIPYDRLLADAVRATLGAMPGARMVCLPFEYQPMERAVTVAAHQHHVAVVGLQTGVYTSNQMGFTFPAQQVRSNPDDASRAPLPDVLAAYGALPYEKFAERLGPQRVCLTGPLRYARLVERRRRSRQNARAAFGLPADSTIVLVPTSALRDESLLMLEATFAAVRDYPDMFAALKFHYHRPLDHEVERFAQQYGVRRYRIVDAPLEELIPAADSMVTGSSSVAVEAVAQGCTPLVFRTFGELSPNPMFETPDAAFFWYDAPTLREALDSVRAEDAHCQIRRDAADALLRAQFAPLDPSMNNRLFEFLQERALLPAASKEQPL